MPTKTGTYKVAPHFLLRSFAQFYVARSYARIIMYTTTKRLRGKGKPNKVIKVSFVCCSYAQVWYDKQHHHQSTVAREIADVVSFVQLGVVLTSNTCEVENASDLLLRAHT